MKSVVTVDYEVDLGNELNELWLNLENILTQSNDQYQKNLIEVSES